MGQIHNTDKLESQVKGLQESLARLAASDQFEEFFRHIHQPGWTTPAEFYLVSRVVDNMQVQLRNFEQLQQTLVEGSRLISEGIPTR